MSAHNATTASTPDSASATFAAVTPNDSTDLAGGVCRYLYVGGAGNLAVHNSLGVAVTISGLLAGSWVPVRTNRVMSTNTTATSILAFF